MSSRIIAIAIQSNGYFVLGEEIFFWIIYWIIYDIFLTLHILS